MDAKRRKEKMKEIEDNVSNIIKNKRMMAILLNSSKTKISNNSHKISLIKLEKDIEDTVNSNDKEKNKRLSFLDIGHCLNDLKIFRELFQNQPHIDTEKSNKGVKKLITYKKEHSSNYYI